MLSIKGLFLSCVMTFLLLPPSLASLPTRAKQDHAQSSAHGKQSKKGEEAGDQISPELSSLLFQARSVPAEFRSDALTRIALSNLVKTSTLRAELLEEAYESASGAKFPVKKSAFDTMIVDTRLGYLAGAYDLNLDSLSLRCRAINALLKIDDAKARELFAQISIGELIKDRMSCQDGLIYDVAPYYETLANVARSFNKKQIAEGRATEIVEDSVYAIISPVQLAPVAQNLMSLELSMDDLSRLGGVFCQKLRELPSDCRVAGASAFSSTGSIHDLASYFEKRGLNSYSRLVSESYRDYMVKSLSGRVCADVAGQPGQLPSIVRRANAQVFRSRPIVLDQIKSLGVDPAFQPVPYWTSTISNRLLEAVRALRFGGSGSEQLSKTDRETFEWTDDFNRVMKQLGDWKSTDEPSEEDYLNEKAVIFNALLELDPSETLQSEVMEKLIRFLDEFSLDRVGPAEWFGMWRRFSTAQAAPTRS